MPPQVNLSVLRDRSSADFVNEVRSSHIFLADDQQSDFFSVVLGHFDDPTLSQKHGTDILRCMSKVISIPKHMKAFALCSAIHKLPIDRKFKVYVPLVLDVLLIVVSSIPLCFDEQVAPRLGMIVKYRGKESLVVLGIFFRSIESIGDPAAMFDVVLQQKRRFSKEDVAGEYAMLLSLLVQKFPTFRKYRGQDAWTILCDLLDIDDPFVLSMTYNACCGFASRLREYKFPYVKAIAAYMRQIPTVVPFLLMARLDFTAFRDQEFVSRLLSEMDGDKNVLLLLMRFAENEDLARLMVDDASWMERNMSRVDILDALRLFLIVFRHVELRPVITQAPEFVKFMLNLTLLKNELTHDIVCMVIRRCEVTTEFIDRMSRAALLQEYIGVAQRIGTTGARHSAILVVDTIANICYTQELLLGCTVVVEQIEDGQGYAVPAVRVADLLFAYKQCAKKLLDLRIVPLLRQLRKNPEAKKVTEQLLDKTGWD